LLAQVAVVDAKGIVVATNDAPDLWPRQGRILQLNAGAHGRNYINICRQLAAKNVPGAQAAFEGIQDVLEKRRRLFELEYPSPGSSHGWFQLTVTGLRGAMSGALIAHSDITEIKRARQAAETNNSTVDALLSQTKQAVIAVSRKGKISIVKGNAEKIFGYKPEELIGRRFQMLIDARSRDGVNASLKRYFQGGENGPLMKYEHLTGMGKNGTSFPIEIALSGLELGSNRLVVAFINDISLQRELETAARTYAEEIRALAARLLTVQEEERRRVSRDLHDDICQQLAALTIDISRVAGDALLPEKTKGAIQQLQASIIRVSEATRHIAYGLHPSVLDDLGLAASLQALCKEFSRREGIQAAFTSNQLPGFISGEAASCLYRVAQESLHNVAKHSGAQQVVVDLLFRENVLRLTVIDNGSGYNVREARGHGGLGVIGLQERVRLMNGTFTIQSYPGKHTTITAKIPVPLPPDNQRQATDTHTGKGQTSSGFASSQREFGREFVSAGIMPEGETMRAESTGRELANEIRILVADDHPLTLRGLQGLLDPHFNCVGSACDGDTLVELALELKPDLIVTDIMMPGCSGIEAARRIKRQLPNVKFLFVTMHLGEAYLENAFQVGGTGYVLKSAASEELLGAVRTVLEGGTYVPQSMREQGGANVSGPSKRVTFSLTSRELDVLKLVAKGKSTKEIAFALGVSVKTVGFHRQNIKSKTGMRSTAEWTKYAIDQFLT